MRAIVIKCFRACCAREEVTKDQQERRRRPREASGDGGAIMRVTVCALHSAAAHRTIRSKSQITKTSKYSLAANAENSQRRYIARRRLAKGLNGKQRQKAAEGETEIMVDRRSQVAPELPRIMHRRVTADHNDRW
ncbi:uncharacterized protein [Anoplolepis gracilipes]|uniref:uncharacterized protein isoform X5 n=1 Tax=Anoplolepis gracilipes TaxID=354296 RepID=UPI003BA203EC